MANEHLHPTFKALLDDIEQQAMDAAKAASDPTPQQYHEVLKALCVVALASKDHMDAMKRHADLMVKQINLMAGTINRLAHRIEKLEKK